MLDPCPRPQALERVASTRFDLLVVGAGITGARVALEATLAGARVALVDAGDFGGATSSASSKLIHGGLRYLEMGDLGLVREAHAERRALTRVVAPHLVRSLDFVVPVYDGAARGRATIGAAMFLYAALSGFRETRGALVAASAAAALVPDLRTEKLRGAGVYRDAQANDARLVLATVTAAARAGALVLNRARVTALEMLAGRVGGALVDVDGRVVRVEAAAVVNAAGPWVDSVRRLEDPRCSPIARLSKGAHVTVPLPDGWRAGLTVPVARGRVAFAVPWEGTLLLGTTDTDYDGDPGTVAATPADVEAVLSEAAIALPAVVVDRRRVLFAFAGLRVLPRAGGDSAAAPREHVVQVGPAGMVSVAGGKLTTHRRIALDVLRRLPDGRRFRLHPDSLPGAGPTPAPDPRLPPATWAHLVHLYGSEVRQVLAHADENPQLLEPLAPGGPDILAQVRHAAVCEWAMTVDDVLRRRTTVAVRGLASESVRARAAIILESARQRPSVSDHQGGAKPRVAGES